MKPYKTDIAVAMVLFNRPDVLKQVFKAVADARPSRLYLIQDGARSGRSGDTAKIEACREVVNYVDWDCEVIKDFSTDNLGCGRRIFSGLSNVFKREEYAVIIEDDIIIGESFLPFCKEMCERYKDDQRVQMISGMNHLGIYKDCPYDYFFSQYGGAIWGWATWARCWNELDWEMSAMSSPYIQRCLENSNTPGGRAKFIGKRSLEIRENILRGKYPSFWTMHFGLYTALSNRLNIVPKYNMISNIGLTGDTTHAVDSIKKVPRRLRCVFYGKIFDMPENLTHPQYVMDDQFYMKKQEKIMNPSFHTRIFELFEMAYIKLFIR